MRILLLFLCMLLVGQGVPATARDFTAARERMVATIEALGKRIPLPSGPDEIGPSILSVMRQVPRHELVPADVRDQAYEDRPLPIGYGQTISQPYIVALMTHLARPAKHHVVLEVGTGSGYQAAVLSPLVAKVFSIEIVEPLAIRAADRLQPYGSRTSACATGTGTRAGPNMDLSIRSWSPPARATSPSRLWISSSLAGAWSSRSVALRPPNT